MIPSGLMPSQGSAARKGSYHQLSCLSRRSLPRIGSVEHVAEGARAQFGPELPLAVYIGDRASSSTACLAVPHDSLLAHSSSTFWNFMDELSSRNDSAVVSGIVNTVRTIDGVPAAVKLKLSSFADRFASLTESATQPGIQSAQNALSAVHTAAEDAWHTIVSSDLLPSTTSSFSNAFTARPAAPDFASMFSSLSSHGSLFDGTFTESQTAAIVAAFVLTGVVSTIRADVESGDAVATDAELPTEYDRDAIIDYWKTRPVTLFKRSMQTTALATGFLLGLRLDKFFGKEKENEKLRAEMLRKGVDQLGPAYIKVAQALSTRVDLLSPAYYEEITYLQDQVQPFPTVEAMQILEQELGQPVAAVFSKISPEPVAAASLGQVYRATLRSNGAEVAVKVQRPGVLELVALDLILMRNGIEIADKLLPRGSVRAQDILPVLDEWAVKFFREMDYRKEAAVMKQFQVDLSQLKGILVPEAYEEMTTRRVLCAEWIEGEKLSESKAEDVRELCTTLLNAYLIQLLDTGLLHADPHPGNLIRTPDGRICILDYGLVTEVPPKFRVYILEYMAHLSLKDWHAVGDDFVKLQFVAEGSKHPNEVPGLMQSVGMLLEILMAGGGAANLDKIQTKELVDVVGLDPSTLDDAGFMDGFASVLDNLANPSKVDSADPRDRERAQKIRMLNEQVKFCLPPYFVLILRAFSVIEGIALKVDPQYSIINETFPYLSRRLLTDDNEEVRRALRQVLYGENNRMDLTRFRTLFDSLQSFSTDGLTSLPSSPSTASTTASTSRTQEVPSTSETAPVDANTLHALRSILNANGTSYIQQLLVSELAATVESLSRAASVSLLQRALQSSLTSGTLSVLERMGPMRRLIFPFPLPAEIITKLGDVVTLTEEDEVAVANVQMVWSLLQPQMSSQVGEGALQMSLLRSFAGTVQELPRDMRRDLVFGVGRTSQMLLEQIVQRTADRFTNDLMELRSQQSGLDTIFGGGGRTSTQADPMGALNVKPVERTRA